MIPEKNVKELVEAHTKLEDHMTGAIWIRQDDSEAEACIVEVIPDMADDEQAEEPIRFNPGPGFRFSLVLIAGNRGSIEAALKRDRKLARDVAKGKILFDEGDAKQLVNVAENLSKAA
jgi:hypothetical protein